jgi:hypothetical protein
MMRSMSPAPNGLCPEEPVRSACVYAALMQLYSKQARYQGSSICTKIAGQTIR